MKNLQKAMNGLVGRAALVAAVICALPSYAADRTISADYMLTADETVDGVLTVDAGATVDLNGHKLTVKGLAGCERNQLEVQGRNPHGEQERHDPCLRQHHVRHPHDRLRRHGER